VNSSLRRAALLACLLGLSSLAAAWGFQWLNRPPAESGRVFRIQVVENNLHPHVSRVLLLPKGKLVVLSPGQPERWRCLVELSGADRVGEPKRIKCLRKGSPAWILQGLGPEASVPVADFGLARLPLTLEATGYDPGPVDNTRGWVGITKSGERARFGIAAVDPRVIPLGAHLYVEGYGPALAADVGGAIKGHKIDLCFNSTRQANAWGRHKKTRVWRIDALRGRARARWQDLLSPTAQGPLGGPLKLR
jgi:3D (Asp-Asp-Asp) domain-containing protein